MPAPTIDTTVAGASANSYISLADADTYFDSRMNNSDWTGATDDTKKTALVNASRLIDTLDFMGTRYLGQDQALEWPRLSVWDRDDIDYSTSSIPTIIKNAQCEMALVLIQDDIQKDNELKNFESIGVGPVNITTRKKSDDIEWPDMVYTMVAHVLRSSNQFTIERG